jgi:branched-chain amino acid transport system permease protein
MAWGLLPVAYRVPPVLDHPLFTIYGTNFHAYRGFMLLISALMFCAIWLMLTRTRLGLVIQAALTHPEMVGALGHNVPRVFTTVFAGGSALAGLAGVIGGNYLVTEPSMAFTMGPIVFVVVVFGGLGSLAGCFIASLIMGFVQTFAVVFDVSLANVLALVGIKVTEASWFGEVLTIPLPRIGALLPYVMLVLILLFKPRGLMGTRDT